MLSVGGARVAGGSIGIGTLVAFLLYVFFLIAPIGQLAGAVTQYQVGAAAVVRIHEADALPVEPPRRPPATCPPPGSRAGAASPSTTSVPLRPDLPAVHDGVTFAVPPGGMTAFVGPSGAGKTTVLSLIERFYEPDSGRVLVDGVDVRDWPIGELRAAIGYVEQDAPVLSGTLRENLLFGAPEATEAEVEQVLRTTRLDAMVAALPDGLETPVGHRGMKLSGASGSGWPSPGPCCAGPGCCCSTRRPRSSTPSTRPRCATRSPTSPAPRRCWWSRTGSRP